jgi:hypothetical protein
MAISQDLFLLIKSLSSNEKRNFQLISVTQKGMQKNYLKLFELLDSMDSYDRDDISNHFKGEKFISSLHVTENYLFKKILESLRAFHEDNSIDKKINNQIFEAQILENKGFYSLALDQLIKAEKTAIRYHKYLTLLEITPKKAALIMSVETKNLSEKIEEIYQESFAFLEKYQEELKFRREHLWMTLMYRKWRTPRSNNLIVEMSARYEDIMSEPAPSEDNFYAQIFHYAFKYTYQYTLQNYQLALEAQAKVIQIWESCPDLLDKNKPTYISQLSNFIVCCVSCKDYEAASIAIQKLENITADSIDEAGELYQNIFFIKQFYYLNILDFKAAVALIPEIELGLKQYSNKINPSRKLSFMYNNTVALFLTEDYLKASDWLQKILIITKSDEQRKDIQYISRILQLAIYYKLSSNEVLEYLFRSVYRNAKLLEEILDFEKLVLKHFQQLIQVLPGSKEETKIFFNLKSELEKLDDKNKKSLGFEEFYLWVEMQLSKS